ncbi:hypothetical protein Hanom_Chr13g01238151 [Helianthus anomalus]
MMQFKLVRQGRTRCNIWIRFGLKKLTRQPNTTDIIIYIDYISQVVRSTRSPASNPACLLKNVRRRLPTKPKRL